MVTLLRSPLALVVDVVAARAERGRAVWRAGAQDNKGARPKAARKGRARRLRLTVRLAAARAASCRGPRFVHALKLRFFEHERGPDPAPGRVFVLNTKLVISAARTARRRQRSWPRSSSAPCS